jgi:hypothetical protein
MTHDRSRWDRAFQAAASNASSVRVEYTSCARIDTDADAEGFGDFLLAGAELSGRRGVNTDTAVAAQADRGRKRDRLARLGIKMTCLRAGAAERHTGLTVSGLSLPISSTRARIWFRESFRSSIAILSSIGLAAVVTSDFQVGRGAAPLPALKHLTRAGYVTRG